MYVARLNKGYVCLSCDVLGKVGWDWQLVSVDDMSLPTEITYSFLLALI